MVYLLIKLVVSAVLIVIVSEVAKRSGTLGGLIASLPLTSLLAIGWLYGETRDTEKVIQLTQSIFWMVLPSLIFFLLLPVLLRKGLPFPPAMAVACLATAAGYGLMIKVLPGTA